MTDRMRGIGLAKRRVADFLAAELPAYLVMLRQEWELSDDPEAGPLPDPVAYHHNQLLALDKWPTIAVAGARAPALRRTSYDIDAAVEYHARYSLRVFVWVKTEDWDPAIDMRDDLTTAVRRLLVARPSIGVANEEAMVVEETITEDYSDVTKVKGDRWVAGAFIGFDLSTVEVLSGARIGTVSDPQLIAHPALAE